MSAQLEPHEHYEEFVASRFKPGQDILSSLTPEKAELLHAVMLLSGEAGELLDAVKKHVIYNKPLDSENILEEMGDLEFSMSILYTCFAKYGLILDPDAAKAHNKIKLASRYKVGYSDKAAQERADKQLRENRDEAIRLARIQEGLPIGAVYVGTPPEGFEPGDSLWLGYCCRKESPSPGWSNVELLGFFSSSYVYAAADQNTANEVLTLWAQHEDKYHA